MSFYSDIYIVDLRCQSLQDNLVCMHRCKVQSLTSTSYKYPHFNSFNNLMSSLSNCLQIYKFLISWDIQPLKCSYLHSWKIGLSIGHSVLYYYNSSNLLNTICKYHFPRRTLINKRVHTNPNILWIQSDMRYTKIYCWIGKPYRDQYSLMMVKWKFETQAIV